MVNQLGMLHKHILDLSVQQVDVKRAEALMPRRVKNKRAMILTQLASPALPNLCGSPPPMLHLAVSNYT